MNKAMLRVGTAIIAFKKKISNFRPWYKREIHRVFQIFILRSMLYPCVATCAFPPRILSGSPRSQLAITLPHFPSVAQGHFRQSFCRFRQFLLPDPATAKSPFIPAPIPTAPLGQPPQPVYLPPAYRRYSASSCVLSALQCATPD